MTAWHNTSEILKEIFHLRLPVEVPIDKIKAEIKTHVDSYSPIHINLALRNQSNNPREWYGRGLIDYRPNSRELYEFKALQPDWIKLNEMGDVVVEQTELSLLLPETMKFIRSLSRVPRVARLLWIPPGCVLPWHSHCQSPFIGSTPYRKVVVQVPILTPPKVTYRVKRLGADDSSSGDMFYAAGEAWVFNSWHEHQVENHGTEGRLTLYIELPLYDEFFHKLISRAIQDSNSV